MFKDILKKYRINATLLIYFFALILVIVGISYALTYSTASLGLTTGMYGVDETIYGATTFNSANLEMTPILDSEVEEKTDNVINIDFKVRGAQNNSTDRDVIYDIALTDLHLDCQLMNSEYLKWKLVKNGTTLYQGNFSNTIDNPINNRYLLTQIQQDLISYEGTDTLDYDSYNLYIWLSDVCQEEDIGDCNVSEELLEEQNQMLGRMFYGKVEVELYTDSKKAHVKNPLPTGTDACANVKYAFLKDAGDAKVETIEIQTGKPFKKLPTPKKEGYLFGGWYLGNTKVDNDTIVEATTNIELYAKWTPVSYDIIYTLNGGLSDCLPSTGEYDKVVRICKPYRSITLKGDANGVEGATIGNDVTATYEFSGWTSEDIYTQHAKYGTSESSVTSSWTDGTTKNKAEYYKNLYYDNTNRGSVNLVANWGTVAMVTPTLTKPGWRCTWNTKKDGTGTSYTPGSSANFSSSQTLYAQCSPNTYKINYNLNNGTAGSKAPPEGNIDVAVNISNPTKTVTVTGNANSTGATIGAVVTSTIDFAGWVSSSSGGLNTSTAKTGTTETSINTTWSGSATTNEYFKNLASPEGTVTIAANWTAKTINLPSIKKTGYTCTWNTKSDGTGTSYNSGASYTIASNSEATINLYGVCTQNTYNITYNYNSGTVPVANPTTYNVNTNTFSVNQPSRPGYVFNGWTETITPTKWYNGFINFETGAIEDKNTSYPSSVYSELIYVESGVTYTLSSSSTTPDVRWRFFNTSGAYVENGSDTTTFTPSANGYVSILYFNGCSETIRNASVITSSQGTSVPIVKGSTGNREYTANWTASSYSISYTLSGGTVSTANPTSYNVGTTAFTLNNPTRAGYSFSGWTEKISTSNWYSGFVDMNTGVLGTSSDYPNAHYSELIYLEANVTYTLSGTSLGGIRWRYFTTSGSYVGSTSDATFTPTSNGYVRILLYENTTETNRNAAVITSSQGTTVPIAKGSTGNRNYTALYLGNSYTLTANSQQGIIPSTSGWSVATGGLSATKSVTYTSTYGTLPNPTKSGYLFGGWSLTSNQNIANQNLPSEYEQVNYIESTGTQYIDTGFVASNGFKGLFEIEFTNLEGNYVAGSHNISSPYGRNGVGLNGSLNWEIGTGDTCPASSNTPVANKRYTLDFSTIKGNSYLNVNGERLITTSDSTERSSNNIFLFYNQYSQNMGGSTAKMKLYSAKIYDNSTLVRNLVPCYRKSDNVVGLYDKVNSTFYTNAGSGTFSYGAAMNYVTSSSTVNTIGNHNIYANWLPNSYTVTANAQGGTISSTAGWSGTGNTATKSISYNSSYGTLPTVAKAGYTLNGYSLVPNEYQQVEYIETDGNQFIDTGVTGTARWEFDIQFTDTTKRQLMGYGGSGSEYWGIAEDASDGSYGLASWSKMSYKGGNRDFIIHNYGESGSYYLQTNGITLGISTTDVASKKYGLFNLGAGGSYGVKSKFYRLKTIQGRVLVRDFIPCYRKSDGVIGLYDRVNNKFYTNTGTGSFMMGSSVTIPNEYQRVDYIESTGTQYIDTGFIPNQDTRIVVKASSTGPYSVYGVNNSGTSFNLTGNGSGMYYYWGGGTNSTVTNYLGQVHVFEQDKNICKVDSKDYYSYTYANWSSPVPIALFGRVNGSNQFNDNGGIVDIYYTRIYDNGVIVRDFVPVYRKSDGVIGLYDVVNGEFYTNAGTGTFNKGSNSDTTYSDKVTVPGNHTIYANWGNANYTVTYNSNGSNVETKKVAYGTSMPSVTPPSVSGYDFLGYYSSTSARDLTWGITDWSSNASTIRLEFGGTGNGWLMTSADSDKYLQAKFSVTVPNATSAPALDFNDININAVKTEQNGNVWTYYVYLDITSEMVQARSAGYDVNYRFIDVSNVTAGSSVSVAFAVLNGKKYNNSDGSTAWFYDTPSDMTVYAKLKQNAYTVKYNVNGGTGTFADQTKIHGTALNLHNGSPTRTGYTFQGWGVGDYNNNSCSNVTTAGYSSNNGVYTANANVLLCAVWEKTNIAVSSIPVGSYISYTANGYSSWRVLFNNSGQIDIVSTSSTENVTLSGNSGYTESVQKLNSAATKYVTGLATSARSIGCTADSQATISVGNNQVGLTGSPYTDTYYTKDFNQLTNLGMVNTGQQVWLASRLGTDEKNYGFTTNSFGCVRVITTTGALDYKQLQNYTITGWKDAREVTSGFRPVVSFPSGLSVISGSGTENDPYVLGDSSSQTYTVKYNLNGGNGTFTNQTKNHGVTLNLNNGSPTKTGYNFQGWGVGDYNNNSCSNATTAIYPSTNGIYTANANVLLCAVWEESTGTDTPSEDTTNPTINVSNTISGSAYNGTWTNKSIDSAITFSDSGSGIDPSTLSYKCNSHSDWVAIDNSSTTSATDSWGSDRNETCYYRIADNSGNYATTEGFTIKIDKTAPTAPTYAAYYSSNNSSYTSGSTASSEVYTTISSTDSGSGVSYIQYKETSAGTSSWATLGFGKSPLTQNGTTWSGSEHWTFTNGRNQTFHFRACDTLGNCSGTSNNFNIVYGQAQVYSVSEDFADATYDSKLTVNLTCDSSSSGTGSGMGGMYNSTNCWKVSNGVLQGTGTVTGTISFKPTSSATLSFDYNNAGYNYGTMYIGKLIITLTGSDGSSRELLNIQSITSGSVTGISVSANVTYTINLSYSVSNSYGSFIYGSIDNLKIQ